MSPGSTGASFSQPGQTAGVSFADTLKVSGHALASGMLSLSLGKHQPSPSSCTDEVSEAGVSAGPHSTESSLATFKAGFSFPSHLCPHLLLCRQTSPTTSIQVSAPLLHPPSLPQSTGLEAKGKTATTRDPGDTLALGLWEELQSALTGASGPAGWVTFQR